MLINYGSKINDVLQAIAGTWSYVEDNGWTAAELGKIKLYKKVCTAGDNVLPGKFMKDRNSVIPYMSFTKNGISGGVIGVQDQYITLDSNAVVIIMEV